jgi:hypothetical protein
MSDNFDRDLQSLINEREEDLKNRFKLMTEDYQNKKRRDGGKSHLEQYERTKQKERIY